MAGAVSERKYTPEQREAVYRLLHEEHKTAPEAVALAADGVYGLEPFHIPAASVRTIARRVKLRRDRLSDAELVRMPPQQAIASLSQRLIVLFDGELRGLERDAQRGAFEPERLRWLLRCHKELRGVVKDGALATGLSDPASDHRDQTLEAFVERWREAPG